MVRRSIIMRSCQSDANKYFKAMAKRPHTLNRDQNKPIIVALHGAGVEADSEFWINSLPPQRSSWVRTKLRVMSVNCNN